MASFLSRERMSPVDTAWLRMDSSANLMMIVGVMVLQERVDVERLIHLIETRLLTYRRFRSRCVQDATGAWWEEAGAVDMDYHLVRTGLPGHGTKEDLEALVARLAAQPLDPERPLWQMHLVENYHGGTALITRIHHCIADGIALIGVLMSMTTTSPDADPPARHERARGARRGAPWDFVLRPVTRFAVGTIKGAADLAVKALQGYQKVLADSSVAGSAASEVVRAAMQVSKDAAALALMDNDTATSLKGEPTGTKAVAWCEPLPLADVKGVGKSLGCSVNDVLLSCVAGAIRGYLVERGESLERAELRAMVPVNLRGASSGGGEDLGNKFGLVPVLLPIGIEHPIERVLEVKRRMGELKGGYTALLAMGLLGVAGVVPGFVQRQMLDIFARKTTAVMTNVPGPQHPLYLAGAHVTQNMFWVPQSGNVGVGVSILSYDGGVQFGLITDKALCSAPQKIIDRFAPEFENLVYALLLAPWDEALDPEIAEKTLSATETAAHVVANLRERGERKAPNGQAPTIAELNGQGTRPSAGNGAAAPAPLPPPGLRKRRSAFGTARRGS
ncbi:MAG TPA: wax ester/triacylglycerol synthase family O-acyltransferase [Burkholderiaceae bacterium]|nr:wax ester/triacylglycerol synthase family O-acyltransferase [Burkholderiaceae bacterium]